MLKYTNEEWLNRLAGIKYLAAVLCLVYCFCFSACLLAVPATSFHNDSEWSADAKNERAHISGRKSNCNSRMLNLLEEHLQVAGKETTQSQVQPSKTGEVYWQLALSVVFQSFFCTKNDSNFVHFSYHFCTKNRASSRTIDSL